MPILVVADIHANLAALDAVLADAGDVEAVWSLGDMVGYGPQPNEVLDRLRDVGAMCVAGNHEWAALGKVELWEFNPAAAEAARWTQTVLSERSRSYLAALPTVRVERRSTLVHGSPRDPIWEYVLDPWTAAACFEHLETRVCFFGHTHLPTAFGERAPVFAGQIFGRTYPGAQVELHPGDRYLLNPGSVGQPRDGDPRASYLLWEPEARLATWRRVEYDCQATQALMQAARLPDVLWQRLSVGQ